MCHGILCSLLKFLMVMGGFGLRAPVDPAHIRKVTPTLYSSLYRGNSNRRSCFCDQEGLTLGISVHCLAVFCLCHHFRFPGGHRHHFLLLRQIEMIKWQIGTHTQLEFSQFETDACPASGRAWITAGCSIIHNDKHTILFSCCRSTSYEWHSR